MGIMEAFAKVAGIVQWLKDNTPSIMGRSAAYTLLGRFVETWVRSLMWPCNVSPADNDEWNHIAETLKQAGAASGGSADDRFTAAYTAPAMSFGELLEACGRWIDLMKGKALQDWSDSQVGPGGAPLTYGEKVKLVYWCWAMARKFRLIDPAPLWSVTVDRELYQRAKAAGDSFVHWGSEGTVYDPNVEPPWSSA